MHHSTHTIPQNPTERERALTILHEALRDVELNEFSEIWIEWQSFPSMCALINKGRGWLMYLRYDGDAGFSSRASDRAAESDQLLEFYLANGQRDEYPVAWTLPTQEVLMALEAFAQTGSVPEEISWYNDSGDGTFGPNDRRFIVPS